MIIGHGWHVIVLGIIIYVTLYAVLNKKVAQPLQDLYVKIYAITKGDFNPVSINSNIMEIQEMGDGISFLLKEIKKSVPKISLVALSHSAHDLRSIAKEHDALTDEERNRLMAIANTISKMEEVLSTNLLLCKDN